MQAFLIILHVIACLFLVAVILLQAGRGGGLSDIAGGNQAQSILGTETNAFMKRLTEIFAVIFILTSLSLGIISTHRGKSLIEKNRHARNTQQNAPISAESQKAIEEALNSKAAEAAKSADAAASTASTAVTSAADQVSTATAVAESPAPVPSEADAK